MQNNCQIYSSSKLFLCYFCYIITSTRVHAIMIFELILRYYISIEMVSFPNAIFRNFSFWNHFRFYICELAFEEYFGFRTIFKRRLQKFINSTKWIHHENVHIRSVKINTFGDCMILKPKIVYAIPNHLSQ